MDTISSSALSDLLANATSPHAATLLASISSWKAYIAPAALGYVLLCRALRYRGERNLRRDMGFPAACGREPLSRMTNDEAQQIIRYLSAWEFPEFQFTALQFGLFKVGRVSLFPFLCVPCPRS